MKAVLDNIIFARQKYGGISVVWFEMIKRILNNNIDYLFIDFSPVDNIMRQQLSIPEDKRYNVSSRFVKIKKYLPVLYHSKERFVFHSSYFRTCISPKAINITTVHDFTNEYFQRGQSALKDRWIKNKAIKHSDYIICISENTRKDFLRFYPHFPKDRISVIYNGVSEMFHPIEYISEWPYKIPIHSYLLFVGERGGYKNFSFVIEIMNHLDINLIITGNQLTDDEVEQLKHIKGHYLYAGRVKADELNILYNYAISLIYPSSYEGFGLPVIEAQRAGCPVIALKKSSIPEIIGNTPLLLESLSVNEAVSKIKLLSNSTVKETIIIEGFINSKRFSWDKTFAQTMELYIRALSGTSR